MDGARMVGRWYVADGVEGEEGRRAEVVKGRAACCWQGHSDERVARQWSWWILGASQSMVGRWCGRSKVEGRRWEYLVGGARLVGCW